MQFAIVGLDCLLPGSAGADAWLARTRAGTPAIVDVPMGRWAFDPQRAKRAAVGAPDATPTLRGGFVDEVPFDRTGLDLGDFPIERMDPLFRQVIHVVRGALPSTVDRDRTDLLLANLLLPSTGAVAAMAPAYGLDLGPWSGWDVRQADLPALLAARALGLRGHVSALDAA